MRPLRVLTSREAEPRVTRRALLGGFTVLGASTLLSGCGDSRSIAPSADPDGTLESQVNIYSWGDYSDPKDISEFTKRYGPRVEIGSFGSNQELISKLSAGRGTSGWDVVVPTSSFVPEMSEHDLLQKLDKTLIPNFAHMDPSYIHQSWDPHNDYSICKASGTTGFLYDTTAIKRPMTSWKDFLDAVQHDASGKVAMQTDPWEVCCCYFAAHDIDPNTTKKADLDACEKYMLSKVAPHVKAYLSTATNAVAQGGFTLIHAYNGDARQAILAAKHPKHWKFVYPTPTANLWMDNWAIARGTQHPDAAYRFINYMLSDEIAYKEMLYIGYPNGIRSVEPRAKREKVPYRDLVFPSTAIMKRLTPAKVNAATGRQTQILNKTMARSGS